MLSELTKPQLELANYMAKLSEAAYSAACMDGLEFALWRLVVDGTFEYGQIILTTGHRQELIALSEKCGGWIVFHDQLAEKFVSADEWLKIYRTEGCRHEKET